MFHKLYSKPAISAILHISECEGNPVFQGAEPLWNLRGEGAAGGFLLCHKCWLDTQMHAHNPSLARFLCECLLASQIFMLLSSRFQRGLLKILFECRHWEVKSILRHCFLFCGSMYAVCLILVAEASGVCQGKLQGCWQQALGGCASPPWLQPPSSSSGASTHVLS